MDGRSFIYYFYFPGVLVREFCGLSMHLGRLIRVCAKNGEANSISKPSALQDSTFCSRCYPQFFC